MPEHANKVTPVMIGNNGDGCISSSPADADNCKILAHGVIGSACCREKHAGGKRKRNGSRGNQGSGAPLLKYFQERGHSTLSKFTLQISRSGFACDSESEISA